jgi:hypothetical protein
MNRISIIVVVAMLLGFAGATARANIFQPFENTTLNASGTLLGQSFTADNSIGNLTSFLFVISSNDPSVTATAKLYAGVGYGGSLLDTDSVFLSSVVPFDSGLNFDFSGNSLTAGSVYTVQVTSDATLLLQAHTNDLYTGGALLDSTGTPQVGDFKFFIEGTSVPEPGSLSLFAAGAGMMLGRRKSCPRRGRNRKELWGRK